MGGASDRGLASVPPPPLCASAAETLRRLADETGAAALASVTACDLLLERARLMGLTFADGRSAGGACHLLPVRDGVIAASLPRESDWELVPAWLECGPVPEGDWPQLATMVSARCAAELRDRARLLGLAVAVAVPPAAEAPPFRITGAPLAEAGAPPGADAAPRVLDLSALWAGPLCAHLLERCGADVIKVEHVGRPDGARFGNAAFYALLNQRKRSVALDFGAPDGRRALDALIEWADIVIEAARPRALRQLGVDAEAILRRRESLTWISITGYGRDEPEGNWIAFGDDAGVAAGLTHVIRQAAGRLAFAGDAIADPLTGIRAALLAWRSWRAGGSRLIALALADVAAASLAEEVALRGADEVARSFGAWWESVRGRALPPAPTRPITGPVAALGEHNRVVLDALGS
ncbi:MAG TPA: CoA transferase [Pseudomonadales bacterium]